MEAALLMLDVFAMAQVLVWAGRGRGGEGVFAWRRKPGAGRPADSGRKMVARVRRGTRTAAD